MDELGLVSGDRLYVLCSQEDELDQASSSSSSPSARGGVTHRQIGEETSRANRETETTLSTKELPSSQSSTVKHQKSRKTVKKFNEEETNDDLVDQEIVRDECRGGVVHFSHLVEFLRGEMIVDTRCTNRDLLCFTLHMIMMDTGYQPTVR